MILHLLENQGGNLVLSKDGGNTFTTITVPSPPTPPCSTIAAGNLFVSSSKILYSFQVLDGSSVCNYGLLDVLLNTCEYGQYYSNFSRISFGNTETTHNTGIASGIFFPSDVYYTSDGGSDWTQLPNIPYNGLTQFTGSSISTSLQPFAVVSKTVYQFNYSSISWNAVGIIQGQAVTGASFTWSN